jgi:hypothetical protein
MDGLHNGHHLVSSGQRPWLVAGVATTVGLARRGGKENNLGMDGGVQVMSWDMLTRWGPGSKIIGCTT